MMKKLAIAVVSLILLAPTLGLVTVGLVVNPTAIVCLASSGLTVGKVPDSLLVTTANGETITLDKQQLTHAATIITVGSGIEGVTRDAIQIALMAALTESMLRQLANTGAYPESGNYPNDGNGSDHDSLGLFQMRPQSGWGSVAELMDPEYQAKAFFGGPAGPNFPSPRGLLDIPGWQSMGKGEVAQAVEVSAYPDRYNKYEPVAETILVALTSGTSASMTASAARPTTVAAVAEASRVVFPLPEGTWVHTSDFGPRIDPLTGERAFHTGTDFAAPDGTPILAVADGIVTVAEFSGGYGGLIVIEHRIGSTTIATAYAHMWQHGIHVSVGERVIAGQHIGDVGSSGRSTGPHLHFEVRPGGTSGEAVDAAKWLNDHDAADLPEATAGAGCSALGGGLS
ncbi:MAG: M23 family metallopeptidase [Cryobacterium sp.]|nr:M23 family metallopeptidase [Cryobacterium sp.]